MKGNLLSYIIEMLQKTKYRNNCEEIQTALGKYHLPTNFKDTFKKIKREWQR
jgi:hypothetical protein